MTVKSAVDSASEAGAVSEGVTQLLDEDRSGTIDEREFRLVAEVLADPYLHPTHAFGGLACLAVFAGGRGGARGCGAAG